jgi:hypothetical protein
LIEGVGSTFRGVCSLPIEKLPTQFVSAVDDSEIRIEEVELGIDEISEAIFIAQTVKSVELDF